MIQKDMPGSIAIMNSDDRTATTSHTPGPWTAEKSQDGTMWVHANRAHVAETVGKFNASLIAAAPDLLSIARRWAALDGGSWHVERHASDKKELLADTNAAIAKASQTVVA